MTDLQTRFSQSLDNLAAPDLRPDIERRVSDARHGRAPGFVVDPSRDPWRRVAVVVTAFAIFAVAGVFAWRAFDGDRDSTPGSTPSPPGWLIEQARRMASSNGDPVPASARWVLTDARTAAPAVGLSPQQAIWGDLYLVVLEGDFTAWMASTPRGTDAPTGSTLAFVADPTTHQIVDWGVSDRAIAVPGLLAFDLAEDGSEGIDGTAAPVPDPVEMAVDEAVIRHLVESDRADWETIYVRETICENAATGNEPKGCTGEFSPEEQSLLSERLSDVGAVVFVAGFEDLPSGLGGKERSAFVWLGPLEGHDGGYEVGGSMSCGPLCGTGSVWEVRDQGTGFKVVGSAEGVGIWVA
jgi:hypothetical protein